MVEVTFGHKKLAELITLVNEETVNVANGKQIMMRIIDGDQRLPSQIAAELGMTGKVELSKELIAQVKEVVDSNPEVVKKVIKSGKQGPVMHLVGIIMKAHGNRADPVMIKHMIEQEIKKVKIDPKDLKSDEDD